ncbi:MAG: response regulator [Candidatus Binataceae bacterium]
MPEQSESKAAKSDLSELHILLVDDDLAFLSIIEAILRAFGVKMVTVATSGRDAFTKIHHINKVVDVVICDYSMAEGNGLQLLQIIRMGKVKFFRPDACFILLTASGDQGVVGMAARLDVNGYLVKPVTPEKLRETIDKARARTVRIDFERYGRIVVPVS